MDYLKRRWLEGCHTAAQLYREVKQRGFSPDISSVLTSGIRVSSHRYVR
jgi:hypothetical protein